MRVRESNVRVERRVIDDGVKIRGRKKRGGRYKDVMMGWNVGRIKKNGM